MTTRISRKRGPQPPSRTQSPVVVGDRAAELWEKKLVAFMHDRAYSPSIFLAQPVAQSGQRLVLGLVDVEHDLAQFVAVAMSAIVEKERIEESQAQSSLLMPARGGAYLLTSLLHSRQDLPLLKSVVVGPRAISYNFDRVFDRGQLVQIIQENPGGHDFVLEEEKKTRGEPATHCSLNGVRLFSFTGHALHFPYAALAESHPEQIDFALGAVAELTSKIHHVRPFYHGGIFYYHRYVSILKELLGDGFQTGLLSRAVEFVFQEASGEESESSLHLELTRDGAKRALKGQRPEHIKYVLWLTQERKVVVGIDCHLNFEEIERKLQAGTLLGENAARFGEISLSLETAQRAKSRLTFGAGGWGRTSVSANIREKVLCDASGQAILRCSAMTIGIEEAALRKNKDLVVALLDAIYDGMLFYTNSVPDNKLGCVLTETEVFLLGGIAQLARYYNYFARRAGDERFINEGRSFPTDLGWILSKMRESGEDDIFRKILFVLRETLREGEKYIAIFTRENPVVEQAYREMLAMIASFEKIVKGTD